MKTRSRTSSRKISFRPATILFAVAALSLLAASLLSTRSGAQTASGDSQAGGVRIGERLTYTVSIGRISNAAYAELYAVSRGRLSDKDAIELRARFKTLDLASATAYLIDET